MVGVRAWVRTQKAGDLCIIELPGSSSDAIHQQNLDQSLICGAGPAIV